MKTPTKTQVPRAIKLDSRSRSPVPQFCRFLRTLRGRTCRGLSGTIGDGDSCADRAMSESVSSSKRLGSAAELGGESTGRAGTLTTAPQGHAAIIPADSSATRRR